MPSAVTTELKASSTGMPAAMSAPNATRRMANVIGRLSASPAARSDATCVVDAGVERRLAGLTHRQVAVVSLYGRGGVEQLVDVIGGVVRRAVQ